MLNLNLYYCEYGTGTYYLIVHKNCSGYGTGTYYLIVHKNCSGYGTGTYYLIVHKNCSGLKDNVSQDYNLMKVICL
jgi:hypothetical protein